MNVKGLPVSDSGWVHRLSLAEGQPGMAVVRVVSFRRLVQGGKVEDADWWLAMQTRKVWNSLPKDPGGGTLFQLCEKASGRC